jgi:AcrR family transcriptional regulator
VGTRTRLTTDSRRAQLLEVALELFGSRPYGDLTMDEVAAAAGVSHGLVYHYFPDKRSLYLAVISHVGEQMLAANTADLAAPLEERLRAGLEAHLQFAAAYPEGYTALIAGGNGSDERVRALCEELRWRGLAEILRTLEIDDPSPRLRVALRGWAGFQEGAIIEWLKGRDLEQEQLLDLLSQALGAALASADVPLPAD